jgi:hypothetical protein
MIACKKNEETQTYRLHVVQAKLGLKEGLPATK